MPLKLRNLNSKSRRNARRKAKRIEAGKGYVDLMDYKLEPQMPTDADLKKDVPHS